MTALSPNERIESARRRFGAALTVVGHHYQADAVIRHADLRGDSLELARRVKETSSQDIVFCGVYFMAESAALLARKGQRVHLPEPSAECSMSMMSEAPVVETVLRRLAEDGRRVVPLAYVNSTLGLKSLVGAHGGTVCTSANAATMLRWALEQGDAVIFLPDKNLGWNMADTLGMPVAERAVLSVRGKGELFDPAAAAKARLLLWPGFCSIHIRFNTRQIERMRAEHPGARVVVHPECTPEVVAAADAAGSTSFIIRYVNEAPDGAVVIVGTEINLVKRLADENRGRVTVLPLVESACTHMAQTTEERLAACLDAVAAGDDGFMVTAPEELRENAKLALERMLRIMQPDA
ncbi:MAG: quinolinate synthase NadA [Desulfovibrio sp.]|jgi:quinolinate synthase|nr:quinolinate synthase NadA [Desulfovibrio sp.]